MRMGLGWRRWGNQGFESELLSVILVYVSVLKRPNENEETDFFHDELYTRKVV